jgi:hypothetical protein
MAASIIHDKSVYFDGYDLTGRTNAIALDYGVDLLENTTIDMDARSRIGGLPTQKIQVEGYVEIDSTDKALFDNAGIADKLISIGVGGDAVGDIAYTMKAIIGEITEGAKVGELYAFSLGAESNSQLIRSTMLLNSKGTALTSSGNGSGLELGAIASGKTMYAALHVLNVGTGSPTLDLILQSDDANNFPSATSRITFDQVTAIGSQLKTLAGPVTDTWWRPSYTIGGSGPSFKAILIVGIK